MTGMAGALLQAPAGAIDEPTIALQPGQAITPLLNANPSAHFLFPYVAPGQEPFLDPTGLTAGVTYSPTFDGFAPRGGLPDPVAGVVTKPAKWYAIRILQPDSAANRVTWLDPIFRNIARTTPLTTSNAYVGSAGFIWGTNSQHIVKEHVADIDLGFPMERNTGSLKDGILQTDYSVFTSVGNATYTMPTGGATFTAPVPGSGVLSYTVTATASTTTITVTGPRGVHVIQTNPAAGNTYTDVIAVQAGATYTLVNATLTSVQAYTASSSPPIITPASLNWDGGIVEFQGNSTLVFSAQGCVVGADGQGSDLLSGFTIDGVTAAPSTGTWYGVVRATSNANITYTGGAGGTLVTGATAGSTYNVGFAMTAGTVYALTNVSTQTNNGIGATLGLIEARNLKINAQDQYSGDAAFDLECGGSTQGWDWFLFNVEAHNYKLVAFTGTGVGRAVECWHEFNLTGTGPTPLCRTYATPFTQGFGSALFFNCTSIQRPTLGTGDSSQMVTLTGSSSTGAFPFHADEVRFEGCLFIANGNATAGNLATPINIDPANAAAQPIDRVILRNNRYGWSGKTPGSAKVFYTVGYGGATGGTYTTNQLLARGLIAIGATAANGRYPQTFAGAQTQYGLSVNPDGNTVTITTMDWGDFDFKAISAPTGNILLGSNTTVSNYGTITFGGYGPSLITTPATGDLLYYNGTNIVNLAVGTSTQVLGGGTNPAWVSAPIVVASTFQKAESGGDANVLTYTPPGVAGTYRISIAISLKTAAAFVFGWTLTWKDAQGQAQSPTNLVLWQQSVAAGALTFTSSAGANAQDYTSQAIIDIDNSATNIVAKLTTTGGTLTTGSVTVVIERIR